MDMRKGIQVAGANTNRGITINLILVQEGRDAETQEARNRRRVIQRRGCRAVNNVTVS